MKRFIFCLVQRKEVPMTDSDSLGKPLNIPPNDDSNFSNFDVFLVEMENTSIVRIFYF